MVDIEDLYKLAKLATPGPWWIDSHGCRMISHSDSHSLEPIFQHDDSVRPAFRSGITGNLSHWRNDVDASYIASANPSAIIELIDGIRKVQQERDALRAEVQKEQEPIAWMNNQGETTINEIQVEYWKIGGYAITPLYAAPVPAIQDDHSNGADDCFDKFAATFDHDSDEWLDMDAGVTFKSGYNRGFIAGRNLSKAMPIPKREPFAYCYTDVNGRAKEFCEPPGCQIPQDKRIITPLYLDPVPSQAAAIPEGYALAPLEPSTEQIDAGVAMALQVSVHGEGGWSKYLSGLYKQMLSASPKPEQTPEPEVFAYDIGYKLESAKNAGYLIYAKDYEPDEDEVIVNKLCIIPNK